MKATKQYEQLLLSIDVHAPQKLRANIQAENLDDFYSAFNIQPNDPMFKAPEDRVNIWWVCEPWRISNWALENPGRWLACNQGRDS